MIDLSRLQEGEEALGLWKGGREREEGHREPRGVEIDCFVPFPFLDLPLEVKLQVLSSVEIEDLLRCRLVCRNMYAVATHDVIWQTLCQNKVREYWKDKVVWSWFLLYWNRNNAQTQSETSQTSLIQMVDRWAT